MLNSEHEKSETCLSAAMNKINTTPERPHSVAILSPLTPAKTSLTILTFVKGSHQDFEAFQESQNNYEYMVSRSLHETSFKTTMGENTGKTPRYDSSRLCYRTKAYCTRKYRTALHESFQTLSRYTP